MTRIGLVGAGQMGSGIGWALSEGGHDVVTTLAGRSARTRDLVRQAGIGTLPALVDVVSQADVLLVITPPDAALAAAVDVAAACRATGAAPLVADLNAISPATAKRIAETLSDRDVDGRHDFVDGSISGGPPNVSPGTRVYLSGPRAQEVADLRWTHAEPIVVSDSVGDASAVKMCTASVYKGVTAILTQAVRVADHHRVLEHVLADLGEGGYRPAFQIANSAAKAWRYVPEMREIATAQREAGLPPELFEAVATVYEQIMRTDLARDRPESVDPRISPADVVARLRL